MKTPAHLTDQEIEALIERGMLPQGTKPLYAALSEPRASEHPTASWLYRKFRVGSAILTKDEAYRIGNQLDALAAYIHELEEGLAEIGVEVKRGIESLGRLP